MNIVLFMGSKRVGEEVVTENRSNEELDARVDALRALNASGVPYLVAGAYGLFEYTGIFRDTKDLDVFLRRRDVERALAALARAGFDAEMLDPVWIAKGYRGPWYVDVIFSSGNGIASVDDGWFLHARASEVMGEAVLLAPPEEIIWSKAYVCERERFDGNDVAHLIRACGRWMRWERLLARFGEDWEVLLAQLMLFRYAFPSHRTCVPDWVMHELLRRTQQTLLAGDWPQPICRGSLLSKVQYRHVLEHLGFVDARELLSRGTRVRAEREEDCDGASLSPSGAR